MHSKTTKAHLFKDQGRLQRPKGNGLQQITKYTAGQSVVCRGRPSQAPTAEPQCQDLTSDSDGKRLGLSSVL